MCYKSMWWASKQTKPDGKKLKQSERNVLNCLAFYKSEFVEEGKEYPKCCPKHSTIAAWCNIHIATSKSAVKILEAYGLITTVIVFKNGRQTSNGYILHDGVMPKIRKKKKRGKE